jgi:DNA-binding response OmpR family regulator
MQPECNCPLCGTAGIRLPMSLLPERGMVVANGKFAIVTGHEALLLQRLAEVFPRVLSKESLLEWMYQINPDKEPELKIIDVYVCKLRKKISPLGVRIDTLWGKGYALAPDSKLEIVSEAAA